MPECKLDKLATEFTPERITLHIELVPAGGEVFEEPMESSASKLDAVANYAASTFRARNGPAPTPESKGSIRKAEEAEKERVAQKIREGQERSLSGFRKALERAVKGGNPAEIADAKVALARVEARIRATEA